MKRWRVVSVVALTVLGALISQEAQSACTNAESVKTTWSQIICPGTSNERTVTKEGSYTIYYNVSGCESSGAGSGGGGTVTPPPSGGSGGSGGGGGQSGGGGSASTGGSSTTIEPLSCFRPACLIKYFFGESKECTGSSVILANGTYNFTETDLALPARGIPILWSRHYRSNRILPANGGSFAEPADGPLGFGWATPYFARIEGDDTYIDGEGIYTVFEKDDAGNYLSDQTNGLVLKKISNGFELEEIGGLISTFDLNGRLQSLRDRFGNAVTLSYNADWKLAAIIDATGRQALTFTWNALGRIESVTDAAGRTVTYTYDGFGNLSEVNGLGEARSAYTYNTYHGLTSKANALGETYTIDYEYPDRGIVKEIVDPVGSALIAEGKQATGHIKSFGYDFQNGAFYTTEPDGTVRKKTLNSQGRLTSESLVDDGKTLKKVEYLSNRTEKITDSSSSVFVIQRDEWMNLTKLTDADGKTTQITWNSQKRPTQITDPLGVVTRFEYDASGTLPVKKIEAAGLPEERVTTFDYDQYGQLTAATSDGVTTRLDFNEDGLLTRVTDPLGNVSRLEYDPSGHISAAIDANGNRREYTYNALGNLLTAKDPLGNITTFTYGAEGQPVSMVDPLGRITTVETDFKGHITALVDALGNRKKFEYDARGGLTRITQGDAVSTFAYDELGRLTSAVDPEGNETRYEYTSAGCTSCGGSTAIPEKIIDPFGAVTQNLFDKNGRVVGVRDPLGHLSSIALDDRGQVVSKTDANGKVSTFQYDALGRAVSATDPMKGVTVFEYNGRGRLVSLADPEGHVTRYEYDLAGRKTKEIRPMGQVMEFTYYPNGLLKTVKDPKEQVTAYSYDAANRLTEIAYADGKKSTYTYNVPGLLAGYSADGVSGSFTYDALGRKLTETVDYGVFQKTFSYIYDVRGNKASYTSPEGITTDYAYRKNDQLQSVSVDGKVFSLEYDKYRLSRLSTPDGVSTTFTYNANSWLTGMTATGPSGTLLDRAYTYDNAGVVQSRTTEHGAYSYGYDDLYRLTAADNPTLPDEAYSYDKLDNRLTSLATAGLWSYNDNSELIGNGIATYEYDANGNTVKKTEGGQITTYVYNARNRLEKVYLPNGLVATYAYDPFGRRTKKQVGNDVTYYIYADEGLVGEYDQGGMLKRAYGWYPDSLWGTDPLYVVEGGNFYIYHNDRQGTPQRLTDTTGKVVWSAGYTAFGWALTDPLSTVENNLRFPGQYYDAETGLHYNFNRYYDPATGRYTATDPAGDGLNPYAYVSSNPLGGIDPLGLFELTIGQIDPYGVTPIGQFAKMKGTLAEILGALECAAPKNWFTQGVATAAYTLATLAYGMMNTPEDLAHQIGNFIENPGLSTLPIIGPIGVAIGISTAVFMENPNLVTFSEMLGAYSSGALLALGGVEGYRGFKGQGATSEIGVGSAPKSTAIQKYFPDNNGFLGATERKFLMKGDKIDRFGGSDYSRFFSPEGTPSAARSLPAGSAQQPLRTFEVMKPFEVESGTVAPAFGQPGLGIQYRTPVQLKTLLDRGIIREMAP